MDMSKEINRFLDVLVECANAKLQEFNIMNEVPAGKCAKCGSLNITIRYLSEDDELEKRCVRCGCTWMEAPLDKKEE